MKLKAATATNGHSLPHQSGSLRIILAAIIAALLGAGVAIWYQNSVHHAATSEPLPVVMTGELSPATLAILDGLSSPLEIRYYAILDPKSVAVETKNFAARVDQLLSQYEAGGGGKITVTRFDAASDMGPQGAAKDGITPFNLDKGDACYLGLAVQIKDQKESFARLSQDWEAALESDLSRAITRVKSGKTPSSPADAAVTPVGPDPTVVNEVKQALPELGSMTFEEGSQALREAAMKEAQTAITTMQSEIQRAQKRLADSRANGSEAEQQAALKNFQAVQAEQARKIQDITSRLETQLATLKTLKAQ